MFQNVDRRYTVLYVDKKEEHECARCGNTAEVCGGCVGFPSEYEALSAYRRMENHETTPKIEGALMIQCCKDDDGSYIFKMRTKDEEGNWDWTFLNEIEQKIANTRLMRGLTGATTIYQ